MEEVTAPSHTTEDLADARLVVQSTRDTTNVSVKRHITWTAADTDTIHVAAILEADLETRHRLATKSTSNHDMT